MSFEPLRMVVEQSDRLTQVLFSYKPQRLIPVLGIGSFVVDGINVVDVIVVSSDKPKIKSALSSISSASPKASEKMANKLIVSSNFFFLFTLDITYDISIVLFLFSEEHSWTMHLDVLNLYVSIVNTRKVLNVDPYLS